MGTIKREAERLGILPEWDEPVSITWQCEHCGDPVDEPGLCYVCWRMAEDEYLRDREMREKREEQP